MHDKTRLPKILAVIPARGGSKGIPRKNMRLMNGKPLISYAIENALNSVYITTTAVSSDSDEVLAFAEQCGAIALDRDSVLAQDAVTLDPVVYDAVLRIEADRGEQFDYVVTLQPTSPLLTVDVLDNALERMTEADLDSLISVVNSPHLTWEMENGVIVPAYEERLNRQQLPPSYLETGAFFISRRNAVTENSRLGVKTGVFEVPQDQATDIDTKQDWVVCESMLARKKIVFRVDGYKALGLGHIYRGLTLAYALIEHDVKFVCDSRHALGIEVLKAANMPVVEIANDGDLYALLDANDIDVFVNDLLDTSKEYVEAVKARVGRFVSFEDMGEGARCADAVVNAIYEGASPHHNVFAGKEYVCLRDEFVASKPADYSEDVHRILVSFGGTDPLNLTKRVYKIAQQWNKKKIEAVFDFILGPGYEDASVVEEPEKGILVSSNLVRVSDHMQKADMALSSQGRTTFELAAMGVPTIVLAQNEREQLHTFAQMDNGFINLGLGDEVSDEDIESALEWLISAKSVRREMRNRMLANDLKSGITKVERIILGETL